MDILFKRALFALVFCSISLMFGCDLFDDDDSSDESDTTVTGSVVQGPVSGATVFADLDGDRVLDTNEASTTTASDGSFDDLVIPAGYGVYTLVSLGGTDTVTNKPALPMLAPSGAARITPITTLVASVPEDEREELIEDLETLSGGADYDSDPSEDADADFVELVKSVEQTLYALEAVGVTETDDKLSIVESIADAIVADEGATIGAGTSLKTIISTSSVDAVEAIITAQGDDATIAISDGGADALEDIIETVIDDVETAIASNTGEDGNVDETDIADEIDDAADIVEDEGIDDIVNSVSMELYSATILDSEGASTTTADSAVSIRVVIDGFNNFDSAKTYTGATIALNVTDQNSDRSVKFTLSNVSATVAVAVSNSSVVTVDLSEATLTVTATDSEGDAISTEEVEGPFAIFSDNYDSNTLTVNLDEMQELLTDAVADDFETVVTTGTYNISLSATGIPVTSSSQSLTLR